MSPNSRTPAEQAYDQLEDQIIEFQAGLGKEAEVGLIVNGTDAMVHLSQIGLSGQMFVFDGVDAQGRKARLIQHYTQINVQVVAVDKLDQTARRIQ